jgi:hypothetical protein
MVLMMMNGDENGDNGWLMSQISTGWKTDNSATMQNLFQISSNIHTLFADVL